MTRGMLCRVGPVTVLLLFLGAAARPAAAQQEAAEAQPDRWSGAFDLGFNASTGNTSLSLLTTGLSLTHLATEEAEFEWTVGYEYGRSEGEVAANHLESGLKLDLQPEAVWSPFVFTHAMRDPIRRVELQASGGGGAKYTFWREPERGEASLSLATLYEIEEFEDALGEPPTPDRRSARWSLRLKGERHLNESMRLANTTFYQPVWDDAGDYDLSVQTVANVQVYGSVALFLRHVYRRDSTPAEGIEPVDQKLSAGLQVQL